MESKINRIFNEDCLIGMQEIKDKSIDMILCDLPYGRTKNKWDSIIPLDELWKQYERIIKDDGAIVLTAQTPFDKVLGMSNLKLLRYEWIWEKTTATGHLNAKKMPMKAHENILVFYKKLPFYNPQKTKGNKLKTTTIDHGKKSKGSTNYGSYGRTNYSSTERYPRSVIKFSTDRQKSSLHPTQKPVDLFRYLIRTYTSEGDLILDNCIGSGTTAEACILENRNFIGFEIDKKNYDISINRIGTLIGGL